MMHVISFPARLWTYRAIQALRPVVQRLSLSTRIVLLTAAPAFTCITVYSLSFFAIGLSSLVSTLFGVAITSGCLVAAVLLRTWPDDQYLSDRIAVLPHEHQQARERAAEKRKAGQEARAARRAEKALERQRKREVEAARDERSFYTKVRGVSHDNPDGRSRQRIVRKCRTGEALQLVPDPDNTYDANAVMVLRKTGDQVGFLSQDLAEELSGPLLAGEHISDEVSEVTGGGLSKHYGLNVRITVES